MGDVEVPADALWGAQTARAVENFPISGQPVPAGVVHALALLKAAAAEVNAELGVLDPALADGHRRGRRARWPRARHDDQFPIDVFQTGSGTSTNMNVNEVVARIAHLATGDAVHPNDHVNAGQSSNDTFPSALRIAATLAVHRDLAPSLLHLAEALRAKETEFADVVKAGRTHLMDAVPVTLGPGVRRAMPGRSSWAPSASSSAAQATAELPLGRHRCRHRPQRRAGLRGRRHRAGQRAHRGRPSARRPTTSRRSRRRTPSSSSAARCRSWPSASPRSATTCAGCPPGRARGSGRSASPTSSPGRASCPARSTRSSPRPP